MDANIGKLLGHYKITALLGEGGMGAVYRGRDVTLQRDVAIKVMHPHFARQANFQERFLLEARTAAHLDHPGIVRVYDFGQSQSFLYIVMEFIPGDNLRKLLVDLRSKDKGVGLVEAIQLISQISQALDYAHKRGVLHRDIKPDNVMLKPEPSDGMPFRPVITDLGLAKLAEGGMLTHAGDSLGTPAYMSPEQATGGKVDARSDVYSLGILLFELAVGRLPFPAKSLEDARHFHVEVSPPKPRSLRPDLPLELERVILKTLEKNPAQRYPDAAMLSTELSTVFTAATQVTSNQTELGEAVNLMTQYQASLVNVRGLSLIEEFPETPQDLNQDRIQILDATQKARSILLKRDGMTIGREQNNDVFIDSPKVSRQHARIEFNGVNYVIVDLDSTNGTILGNSKLLPGVPEVWGPEKVVRIGDAYLRLELVQQSSLTSGQTLSGGPKTAPYVDPSMVQSLSSTGSLGIYCETTQLSVAPGNSVDVMVIILNQGNTVNHYSVAVTGISADWIKTLPPVIQLMPGEQRMAAFVLQPPRSTKSRAGRYPLIVKVSSQEAADQFAELRITLTVTAYRQFRSDMRPQRLKSGQVAQIIVKNEGNTPETFELLLRDRGNELSFTPAQTRINIQEGKEISSEFQAVPRPRRLFGGEKIHPFTALVSPTQGEAATHTGELVSKGFIPGWILPILFLLCLCLGASSIFAYSQVVPRLRGPTQTAANEMTEIAIIVQKTKDAQIATATWESGDDDKDGLTNIQELQLNTLPDKRDTDEDGLDDGDENNRGTNPGKPDTDGDGLKDGDEVGKGLNPLDKDTDHDGKDDAVDNDPGKVDTPTPSPSPSPSVTPVPSGTATNQPTGTYTNTPSPTATSTLLPSDTPTWTPTPSQTITGTPTVTPSNTVPPSPYTNLPPVIDGFVNTGEWDQAFVATNLPHGSIYYLNDNNYLYLLVDLVDDLTDDPPLVSSPWGDFFWLTFDVNENASIDPNVDLQYGKFPGSYNLGYQWYLNPGSWSGLNPSTSFLGAGFGTTNHSSNPHRFWEFALNFGEIQAAPGGLIRLGIKTYSQNPAFSDDVPNNFYHDFNNLISFSLGIP